MGHPCQFSPEVIEILGGLIKPGEWVHDPFAGTGLRLGALCDEIGAYFSGTDIEEWPGDWRVRVGDSRERRTYPIIAKYTIVTSPVYQNKRLADYANGPTPATNTKGRRDYALSLGRPLHEANLARYTGRKSKAKQYWNLHRDCVKHWGARVLLNVDAPIADGWMDLLTAHNYEISDLIPAYTKRYRGLANDRERAKFEVVIVAEKEI